MSIAYQAARHGHTVLLAPIEASGSTAPSLVACTTCTAYCERRTRGLTKPCPGHEAANSTYSNRLQNNLHPYTQTPLGPWISFCLACTGRASVPHTCRIPPAPRSRRVPPPPLPVEGVVAPGSGSNTGPLPSLPPPPTTPHTQATAQKRPHEMGPSPCH